jgi:bis(5'-nucleosyl)-tetraphosphatase (symmetrical)
MALYLIGDIQGCDSALQRLLDKISFSPSRDTLYLLGDLVNRGPDPLAVLRRLMGLGDSAHCLLGNHDLHLLAVAHGVRPAHQHDTLDGILQAADRPGLLAWLCQQRLAIFDNFRGEDILMVHAGVLPAWTATQTIALANEVEAVLRGPDLADFLHQMYGNEPVAWDASLRGIDRLRVIVNALTRLRFCTPEGHMEFNHHGSANTAPSGYLPWFEAPGRRTANVTVAFGHWSRLGWLEHPQLLALDTGCVWGGALSAIRLDDSVPNRPHHLIQVSCSTP